MSDSLLGTLYRGLIQVQCTNTYAKIQILRLQTPMPQHSEKMFGPIRYLDTVKCAGFGGKCLASIVWVENTKVERGWNPAFFTAATKKAHQ